MRNYAIFSLLLLGLFGLTSGAFAQDLGTPSFEHYNSEPAGVSHDSDETVPENTDPQKSQVPPTAIDSAAATKPARNIGRPFREVQKAKDESVEEDDVLSFNFLYFLIRKYKMQDIVD